MKVRTSLIIQLTICGCIFIAGCSQEKETTAALKPTEVSPANEFALTDAPETAPGLLEALATAKPGEEIVFSGRVGGTLDPVAKEFAGFVVADESLVFCDEMDGEGHCATPWDACCEDPDKIKVSRAFVQFVDDSSNPVMTNLSKAIGLSPNDNVVVRGKLASESTATNPIIIADGVAIAD